MRFLRIFVFLLVWAAFCSPALLRAQSNPPFSSPALDSFCYFPQIGVPGEIDTIVGNTANEGLGDFIHNLGQRPNGSFGNMLIGNGEGYPLAQVMVTGPSFNLHNLNAIAQNLNLDPQYIRFGHFHNSTSVDIFDADSWIIYWADENGDYDSSRHTNLKSNVYGSNGISFSPDGDDLSQAYIAHLTNDTIDDIVVGFDTYDSNQTKDSVYLALFEGGSSLYGKSITYEDTSVAIPGPYYYPLHYSTQGDFRGTGRDDLIVADYFRNVFFFKNDPPFSLQNLLHAMLFDTLWTKPARWRDSNINLQRIFWIDPFETLTMHALPKKAGDSSYDWMVWIPTNGDTTNGIYIFRGGPDFGSHRITIDSAAFVILPPQLGFSNWPGDFTDAGDMTGTGNQVFYTMAGDVGTGAQTFYVTGQALDNKIDEYNVITATALGDTLTANDDSLEDDLLGLPDFVSDVDQSNGKSVVGSLWLMYGSKRIPVHLNPQFADVKSIPQQNGTGISFSPNPAQTWSVATIVWPVSEDGEYSIYDMLGRQMERGPIRLFGGAEQQRIYFSGMAQGVYLYTIEGAHGSASARFVKLGGAISAAGSSQPSIIQQMKDARDGKSDAAGITSPPAIR
jgi:hypothetical protein